MNASPDGTTAPEREPERDLERRGFFAETVNRPVALTVSFLTLLVVGLIAYARIPLEMLPSAWSEPRLNLHIENPFSTAEENVENVTRILEEQLRTLSGIERVESFSEEGYVRFWIALAGDQDIDLAKAEVRDAVERCRPRLPAAVPGIGIWSEDADQMPLNWFGVTLEGDRDRRDALIENVVIPRLEAVPGVARVNLFGTKQESVRILLDEDKVAAARLNIGDVIGRLRTDNFATPMGEIQGGGRELLLRSDMRFRTLEEIAAYPLENGLVLGDFARVVKVKSVANQLSRIDGAFAYYGFCTKASQANVVDTSRAFLEAIEELKVDPALSGGFAARIFFLQGDVIESALSQLRGTALWGGALAVVVLFVFLRRIRLTLCVALAIPVSALLAIIWQYFSGDSFNMLTMIGITLGIGMLVDNAVVVVENIARVRDLGVPPLRAAIEGSREIALAVTLATMTTVVVFLPLIFMTENPMIRVMFGGLGIPLSVSLLASLFVAVVFLPVVAARILGPRPRPIEAIGRVLAPVVQLPARLFARAVGGVRWLFHQVARGLRPIVGLALALLTPLRWPLAALVVGCAAWQVFGAFQHEDVGADLEGLGIELGAGASALRQQAILGAALPALIAALLLVFGLPRWRRRPSGPLARPTRFTPQGSSIVELVIAANRHLVGWTLRHRLAAFGLALLALGSIAIPARLVKVTPFGQDEQSQRVSFRVEFDTNFTLGEAFEELMVYEEFLEARREEYGFDSWSNRFDERSGRIALHYDRARERDHYKSIEASLREHLPRVPGHSLRFYDENASAGSSANVVRFTLRGPDAFELERLGRAATRILEDVPGLGEVSNPLTSAPDQIQLDIDRDLATQLGVDTQMIQESVAYVLRGVNFSRFHEEGRELPFLIEYDEEQAAGLETLRDLSVFGAQSMVPLSSFATLEFTKGRRSIYRVDGQTSFTLEAKVDDPVDIVPTTQRAYAALAGLELPRGYGFDSSDSAGQRQEQEFAELQKAFLLSVVLVFLLMGILFESLALPFSVLFTIPFAVLGAFWTLFATGTAMDSMGWIGVIILAGVVVNNGIVLIDRIHLLRATAASRAEAVIEGCSQRVRPILMTALTTISGLLPMILTEPPGEGIDYRTLSTIVAGGLGASTFFTLWVVPLAYTVIDDLARLFSTALGESVRTSMRCLNRLRGAGLDRIVPR
ncbi:MAG: efflux RND transporter permease subunit [Planctomycetota bacterium]